MDDAVTFTRRLAITLNLIADSIKTNTNDPELAHNELCVDDCMRIVVEPLAGREPPQRRPQPRSGINPITLTPRDPDQPFLVLSRMHLRGVRNGSQKTVTAMMHDGNTTDEALLGLALFDEDQVIDGLMHLFPNGELVPREEGSDSVWPCRKVVWETADGKEWHHPDLANDHQRSLDREVTVGSEGAFNPWYVIESPGKMATVGEARTPEEINGFREGLAKVPDHHVYSGFDTEQQAHTFVRKKGFKVPHDD
jgi:hypothetical protein